MLITNIFQASDSTVKMTEESAKTAEEGMLLAESTGDAFHNLAASIGKSFEDVKEISSNVKKQAEAILELQEMVEQ